MEQTCERAIAIGLPTVIFTVHLDFDTAWRTTVEDLMPHQRHLLDPGGYLHPPEFDVAGYLDCIERCRHRFPNLSILTRVEFGQPHLFHDRAAQLLDLAMLDRVNGSLHTLQIRDDRSEPNTFVSGLPIR